MKRLQKYVDIRYAKHEKEWDTVLCICGEEGSSKSTLLKHLFEYWNIKVKGKIESKDVAHINFDGKDFVYDISEMGLMGSPAFDEAGEIDARRSLSNFNVALTQGYKVIRAERLFTILAITDFWDLDSRFRLKRVKCLMYVYKRGRVAVWLKKKTRLISMMNEHRLVKNPFVVEPDFYDTFPVYKGVLEAEYQVKKTKKIKETKQSMRAIYGDKPKEEISKTVVNKIQNELLKKLGYKQADRARTLGVDRRTLYGWDKDGDPGIEIENI